MRACYVAARRLFLVIIIRRWNPLELTLQKRGNAILLASNPNVHEYRQTTYMNDSALFARFRANPITRLQLHNSL
jgi:hypothetical protein